MNKTKGKWIKGYRKLLKKLNLEEGAHSDYNDGLCVMEAVAYLRGQQHTDMPKCVSPIIRDKMAEVNDNLRANKERNKFLKPLIPVIINTKFGGKKLENKRRELYREWREKLGVYDMELDYDTLIENIKSFQTVIRKM